MKYLPPFVLLIAVLTLSSSAMAMGKRKPQKPLWPPHELAFVVDSQEWLKVSQAFSEHTAKIKLSKGRSVGVPFDGPFAVRNWDSNARVNSSYGLLAINPGDKPVCHWLTLPRDLSSEGALQLAEIPCDEARSQIYRAQVPTPGFDVALQDQVGFLARVLEERGQWQQWWGAKRIFDVKIEQASRSLNFEHRIGFALREWGTRLSIGTALETGGLASLHFSAPPRAVRELRLRYLPQGKVQYFLWTEWPNRDINAPTGLAREEIQLLNPEIFSTEKPDDVLAMDSDGNCLISSWNGNLLYCGSRPGKPQVWRFSFRWLTLTLDPRDPDAGLELTFGQTSNVSNVSDASSDKALPLPAELTFHLRADR